METFQISLISFLLPLLRLLVLHCRRRLQYWSSPTPQCCKFHIQIHAETQKLTLITPEFCFEEDERRTDFSPNFNICLYNFEMSTRRFWFFHEEAEFWVSHEEPSEFSSSFKKMNSRPSSAFKNAQHKYLLIQRSSFKMANIRQSSALTNTLHKNFLTQFLVASMCRAG